MERTDRMNGRGNYNQLFTNFGRGVKFYSMLFTLTNVHHTITRYNYIHQNKLISSIVHNS